MITDDVGPRRTVHASHGISPHQKKRKNRVSRCPVQTAVLAFPGVSSPQAWVFLPRARMAAATTRCPLSLSLSLSRPVSAEAALSLSRAFSSLKSQVNWGRMESWVPLFNIFLNSPTPETDASRWLQESFNAASAVPITTASFLSLLTEPRAAIVSDSSSCSAKKSETKRFDLLCVV